MKIIFQCYEIVSTLFLLEFSLKTPWKKRSYGESRKETGQISMRMRKRINVWMKRASRWNAYIYIYIRIETLFMGFERKKHSLRLQSRGESLEGIETLASLSNFFFFFFYTARKLKSYTIQNWNASSARGGSNLFPIPRFISDQRGGSPFRGRTFHQLLSFDFYFFFLSPFPFYDNFVVNLKSWTIIALFYFFIESDFCIFENSVRFINLSSRFF